MEFTHISYPVQGHINPLFKLAKLLHLRGFHITFVNTEYNKKRLLKSRDPNSLDGLTPMEGNGDVTQDIYPLVQSIMTNFLQPFDELLTRLHQSTNDGLIPPITCLISDCSMPFTVDATEEHVLDPNPFLFYMQCIYLLVYFSISYSDLKRSTTTQR